MPPFLYRGIPKVRQTAYRAAHNGIVRPLGTSTDYEAHVRDGGIATDVTSWTPDLVIARRFAGHDGVIVRIDLGAGPFTTVPHPLPNYRPHEQEVLIRGLVAGCQVV